MKSYLLISIWGLLFIALDGQSFQTQTPQQKVQAQGALKLDETQKRTLPPDAFHVWNLTLEAGQYVVVEVEQKGIDVVVRIVDPKGTQRSEFDSPTGATGTEKAVGITDATGAWRVEIVPLNATQPGNYEIKWVILRKATERDRQIVEADSLNNLAQTYSAQGKYAEAELLYRRVLSLQERALGPDHPDVTMSLNNLGEISYYQSKYAEAETLFKRSLAIQDKTLGSDHPDVATSFNNLAIIYDDQGKYAEAESLYKRSLAIQEKALRPDHPDVARSLNNLAGFYHGQDKYVEAVSLYRRALAIYEKSLGPNHPDVAASISNLAECYRVQGNYAEAEPLSQRALAIREKALGPDHLDVSISLNNLASLYDDQGKYAEVEPLYRRSLAIRVKSLGPDHLRVALSFNNLAHLSYEQGKYADAESLYKRSLAIQEKAQEPDHPDVAKTLSNLANLYADQGKYAKAEPLFRQSLAIREKALGSDHSVVATSLNNLALLYHEQGNYAEAEPLYRRSFAIFEKALGPDHPNSATSIDNLASLYQNQNKYAEAEPLFRQSLTIREKVLGPDHPVVAISLNNLASLCEDQGKDAEAELLYHRSQAIREKTLGPNHPDVAENLTNLASLYEVQAKYAEAEALINRAIGIWNATTGHPEWRVEAYAGRAKLQKQKENLEGALYDMEEALHSAEQLRPQFGGGEETRAGIFQKYFDHFNRMIAWQIEAGDPQKAIEYAERGKARVLLDQLVVSKIDLRSSIPDSIRAPLENRETGAKARIAEYQQRITLLRSRKDLTPEEINKQIAELEGKLRAAYNDYQQIYEEIKNASPLWKELITSGGKPVSLDTMQRQLVAPQSLMLIYQIGKEGSFLFVIPPAGQKPEVVQLQVSEQVASILGVQSGPLKSTDLQKILAGQDTAKTDIGLIQQLIGTRGARPKRDTPSITTPKLHALWQVLAPKDLWPRLANCSEVILIPDGVLNLLPFEALVVEVGKREQETRYWLDEGPVIRYAPSATTLYNIEKGQAKPIMSPADQATVLSLSDPIYDPSEVVRMLENKDVKIKRDSVGATARGGESILAELDKVRTRDSYERGGGVLNPLPGTAREAKVLRKVFGEEMLELHQLNANEPKLRAGLSGKRYLHLATHGIVDQQQHSSLAALALTPPPGETTNAEDDGFLQLYEIFDLKLPACELAVLSACQTNIGRNFEGEGVFALSRGFLAAGARRVVASQWSVDDISTAELIGEFFKQIAAAEKAGKQIDYALALRDAKRKIRQQQKWAAPYFWAPFVLTGKR